MGPTKTLDFEFEVKEAKEQSGKGIIEGYASTFGNMDLGFDIVDKGAFKKTLNDTKGKVSVLADHDWTMPIGIGEAAYEDEKGLFVRAKLDIENNVKAKERYSLAKMAMEMGAKSGLSIGYATIKAEPDSKNPSIRHLKELKLYEYSLVVFPMNTEALVTAAKSWREGKFEERIKNFIDHMIECGYSEKEVEKALLQKSRFTESNPSLVAQLLHDTKNKLSLLRA